MTSGPILFWPPFHLDFFFDSFKLLTAIKESDSIGDGVAGEKSATKVDWQLVGH